ASSLHFELLEASSLDDALVILQEEPIDLVLVGAESSGASSVTSTRAVLEESPASSVIVLGALADRSCHGVATEAGASAVVSKRSIATELVQTMARFASDAALIAQPVAAEGWAV